MQDQVTYMEPKRIAGDTLAIHFVQEPSSHGWALATPQPIRDL